MNCSCTRSKPLPEVVHTTVPPVSNTGDPAVAVQTDGDAWAKPPPTFPSKAPDGKFVTGGWYAAKLKKSSNQYIVVQALAFYDTPN